MKIASGAILLMISFSLSASDWASTEKKGVKLLGNYSNIVTSMPEDPHQSGYAVSLYRRSDGLVFGDFTNAPGTTEGLSARLLNVKINGRSLYFEAKTSSGVDFSGRASRELFKFSGTLSHSDIKGQLLLLDGYDLVRSASISRISLRRDRDISYSYESYEQYLKSAPPPDWVERETPAYPTRGTRSY